MDLTPWAPLIALGGVALGSAVTFIGQWLIRRQTSELSIVGQKAALRDDRREAIYSFLQAVQGCHDVIMREERDKERDFGGDIEFHQRARVIGELWFRLACIKMMCRLDLIVAANACADTLTKAIGGDREALSRVDPVEAEVTIAARLELYSAEVFD